MYSLKVIEKNNNSKLYQWNTDVYVEVTAPEGMEIHHVDFSHNINGPAIRRSVIVEDGIVKAKVPNKLLQSQENIRVWLISNDQTVYGGILAVAPKAKNDGYVLPDDEDEVFNYCSLEKRISDLEKNISDSSGVDTERIRELIVKALEDTKENGDFKGEPGKDGEDGLDGTDGKTAYQYAKEGGYTGTEEEFAAKLAEENPTKEEFNKLSMEIADLKDTAGKTAYEYALDGGYVGSEEEFAEALANVGNTLNENLFSFNNASVNLAHLSKNKPGQGYIYLQDGSVGYKDTENGYFVFPAANKHIGIVGGLELPLASGSYKVSADIYIPSGNVTKTIVNFGVYVAPSKYDDKAEYDLGVQDSWITIEKVFTVEENDTHVYVYGSNARAATGTYEFYMRNVKVVRIDSDKEQGESIAVKKWAVVGDSITEKNGKTLKNYHDYIAELTGIDVINMGLSGTGYKSREDESNAFYQRILNVPTNADVVTIFGSGNDLGGSYVLGEATDIGTETLCGCINKTIDNLYSVLPTVQLGIITPCPWGSFNPSNDSNLMAQYSAKIVEICRLRGIPCLDLYHSSGLRPWDSAFLEIAYPMNSAGTGRDTVHPNEVGHSILAPRIKAFLESLVM